MKLLHLFICTWLISFAIEAEQVQPDPQQNTSNKQQLIQELFSITGLNESFSKIREVQSAGLRARFKDALQAEEYKTVVEQEFSEFQSLVEQRFSDEFLFGIIAKIYADNYSSQELSELIVFFRTELGRKWLSVEKDNGRELFEAISPKRDEIREIQMEFRQDIAFKLKQAGYKRNIYGDGMTPMQAIEYSEIYAKTGYEGTFGFNVKRANLYPEDNILYLNSEKDYRDRRNITVKFHPDILPELRTKFGYDVEEFFVGKDILVQGIAKRIPIKIKLINDKTANYYQTHIKVTDINQLVVK
ncbi:MAG: DUF2059 domain-containing protein [Aestuariibacter sp.]